MTHDKTPATKFGLKGDGQGKVEKKGNSLPISKDSELQGEKNFDFTLNNGGAGVAANGHRLEEIREQLKEETNILDEWES